MVYAGAVSLAAYAGLVQHYLQTGTLTFASVPATVGWYSLAFLAYVSGLVWLELRNGLSLKLIFGAAILFRLLMLFTVPTLSGDVYRYVWEGYLTTKGVSPYTYPVEAPQLDYLDIRQRAQVESHLDGQPLSAGGPGAFCHSGLGFPAAALLFSTDDGDA